MNLTLVSSAGAATALAAYILYKCLAKNKCELVEKNMITIVHKEKSSSILGDLVNSNERSIDITTHMRCIREYHKMNMDRDIHIVINTRGGSLSSSEAIGNCLLRHKGKGKIICHIPHYAYSGGWFIALCCDKIIMNQTSIIGPCDAQQKIGMGQYSVKAIVDTVAYKKQNKEKIDEKWLAVAVDAELCRTRQREFLDKIVAHGKIRTEDKEKIHAAFFSGNYNHDHIFNVDQLKELLGDKVEIIDAATPFDKYINDLCF